MEDEEDEVAEEVEMTETRNEELRREEEESRIDRAAEVRRLFWELRELELELGVMRDERVQAERRREELQRRRSMVMRGISARRRGGATRRMDVEEEERIQHTPL